MNSVTSIGVSNQNYQMTFGNKINRAKEVAKQVYEDVNIKELWKTDPEKAKCIMRNQINEAMINAIKDIFSVKNMAKYTFDALTMKTVIALGKFMNKCDRVMKKIF